MKDFKTLKRFVLDVAKINRACGNEYKRALSAKNKKELIKVVKDNFSWCYTEAAELVSTKTLDAFGEKLCNDAGIYYKGEIKKIENRSGLIFLNDFKLHVLDNSTVSEMWGNSTVSKMSGNSTVSEMWGNSTVSKMWGNSTVSKMWDNSTVSEMWGNSTVSKMSGNSTVSEMWGNSTVSKMSGNSTVSKMSGNSTVSEMWGNSISRSYNGNKPNKTGNRFCFVDLSSNKVYVGNDLDFKPTEAKTKSA